MIYGHYDPLFARAPIVLTVSAPYGYSNGVCIEPTDHEHDQASMRRSSISLNNIVALRSICKCVQMELTQVYRQPSYVISLVQNEIYFQDISCDSRREFDVEALGRLPTPTSLRIEFRTCFDAERLGCPLSTSRPVDLTMSDEQTFSSALFDLNTNLQLDQIWPDLSHVELLANGPLTRKGKELLLSHSMEIREWVPNAEVLIL